MILNKTYANAIAKIALLHSLALPATSAAEEWSWRAYSSSTSCERQNDFAARIKSCGSAACRQALLPNDKQLSRLESLVQAGNKCALATAFDLRPLLDGGNWEDLTRAIGTRVVVDPNAVLRQVQQRSLSKMKIGALVLMVPLTFADDLPARQAEVKRRIAALRSVSDENLAPARDTALSYLSRHLQDLDEIRRGGAQ
jgi:hypothetical protein